MMGTTPVNLEATRFVITRRAWRRLVRELDRRGQGRRESGAFLLARPGDPRRRVVAIAYYDALDPTCLWGGITFARDGFARLSELCRARGLVVVADVHTHPSAGVAQSTIDATHPMAAIPGHVAMIIPHFAQRRIRPADAGVHVYNGNHDWTSCYGKAAADVCTLAASRWRTT